MLNIDFKTGKTVDLTFYAATNQPDQSGTPGVSVTSLRLSSRALCFACVQQAAPLRTTTFCPACVSRSWS